MTRMTLTKHGRLFEFQQSKEKAGANEVALGRGSFARRGETDKAVDRTLIEVEYGGIKMLVPVSPGQRINPRKEYKRLLQKAKDIGYEPHGSGYVKNHEA